MYYLFESGGHALAQILVEQPVERKERAFDPAKFPQSQGESILSRVAGSFRRISEEVTVPRRMEQPSRRISDHWARSCLRLSEVDRASDKRLKCQIALGFFGGVQPPVS